MITADDLENTTVQSMDTTTRIVLLQTFVLQSKPGLRRGYPASL